LSNACRWYIKDFLSFFFVKKRVVFNSIEVRRTRRAHSIRPDGDTSRGGSRAHSPSPVRSSGRDASWRDKLGAGEKPARDTLDVEKPSIISI
jgi:hypothetical protein